MIAVYGYVEQHIKYIMLLLWILCLTHNITEVHNGKLCWIINGFFPCEEHNCTIIVILQELFINYYVVLHINTKKICLERKEDFFLALLN